MTKAMQNYLELHRHAVARLALLAHPGTALRLLVAHAVAASGHWQVKAEPQQAKSEAIAKSIADSPAQQAFAAERETMLKLFERPDYHHTVASANGDGYRTAAVFARLLAMPDEEVLAGRGLHHGRDPGGGESAGRGRRRASQGRCAPALAARRRLLRACPRAGHGQCDACRSRRQIGRRRQYRGAGEDPEADHPRLPRGTNGRTKVEGWLPGFMAFPFRLYGDGTCAIAEAASGIAELFPTS